MDTNNLTEDPTLGRLIAQAKDAENRIQPAATQDERERWQRIANDWWQKVCDYEAQS